MKPVYLLSLAFVVLGLWLVLDHLRTPRLRFETVRDMPTINQSVGVPPVSVAPVGTSHIRPVVSGPININTATLEQLVELPKVGPKLAQRIMEHRPYQSLKDLDQVKGIGEKMLSVLVPLVVF